MIKVLFFSGSVITHLETFLGERFRYNVPYIGIVC